MSDSERVQKLADDMINFVNSSCGAMQKELAHKLANNHRTLVQGQFGIFLMFCSELEKNKKDGFFDMRNAYACETATQIMKLTDGLVSVPLI